MIISQIGFTTSITFSWSCGDELISLFSCGANCFRGASKTSIGTCVTFVFSFSSTFCDLKVTSFACGNISSFSSLWTSVYIRISCAFFASVSIKNIFGFAGYSIRSTSICASFNISCASFITTSGSIITFYGTSCRSKTVWAGFGVSCKLSTFWAIRPSRACFFSNLIVIRRSCGWGSICSIFSITIETGRAIGTSCSSCYVIISSYITCCTAVPCWCFIPS